MNVHSSAIIATRLTIHLLLFICFYKQLNLLFITIGLTAHAQKCFDLKRAGEQHFHRYCAVAIQALSQWRTASQWNGTKAKNAKGQHILCCSSSFSNSTATAFCKCITLHPSPLADQPGPCAGPFSQLSYRQCGRFCGGTCPHAMYTLSQAMRMNIISLLTSFAERAE